MKPRARKERSLEARFERALAEAHTEDVVLTLFVSGMTSRSVRAVADLRRIASEHIGPRCRLEVVDISQQPERAVQQQVVAVPMLLKERPPPASKVIGSLADPERVLGALRMGGPGR